MTQIIIQCQALSDISKSNEKYVDSFQLINEEVDGRKWRQASDEWKQGSSQPVKWIKDHCPEGKISHLVKWAQVGINTVTQLELLSTGSHKILAGASQISYLKCFSAIGLYKFANNTFPF